jgi:cytochrome c-type biogenesis protein CcsB
MFGNLFLHASIYLQITVVLYMLSAFAYVVSAFVRNEMLNKICLGLSGTALLFNIVNFANSWMVVGRAPIKSLFEALILLTLTLSILAIGLELLNKVRFIGILSSVTIVITLIYSAMQYDTLIANLPAALQSYWFVPHIVVYFFGYAAGGVSFFAAIAYLYFPDPREFKSKKLTNLLGHKIVDFEDYTYQLTAFAFVMLGLGNLMGALWAKEAWGTYWAWDPKENWALVTFMVYAIYLHLRLIKGWRGKKASWFAIAGFIAIVITFLGVNFMPAAMDSVHVYTN